MDVTKRQLTLIKGCVEDRLDDLRETLEYDITYKERMSMWNTHVRHLLGVDCDTYSRIEKSIEVLTKKIKELENLLKKLNGNSAK